MKPNADRHGAAAPRSARSGDASNGRREDGLARGESADFFRCFSCGKRFVWRSEIAGQTFRCACNAKVRAPDPGHDSLTAVESLDDTVADIEVEEHFDEIEGENTFADEDVEATQFRRIPQRGVFGWPMGLDVLFWSILSVVGLSCGIMALLLWQYWWQWVAAFVVIGPYSFFRLYRSWPRWTQGRPWIDCLLESLGADEAEDDEETVGSQ